VHLSTQTVLYHRLVGIAEKCEVHYKLKRDDHVANRQSKIHVSSDNDRGHKKIHIVSGGNHNPNEEDN
jgi:hypothetical protein